MPARPKLLVGVMSLLVASFVAPACKPDRAGGGDARLAGPSVKREAPRPRGMPRPLPLPSKPEFAAHLANPGQALVTLAPLLGMGTDPRAVLRALSERAPAGWGTEFLEVMDLEQPYAAAIVEGQVVMRFVIRRSAVPDTKRKLATKTPVGDWGAVEIGRSAEAELGSPPPPRLAWLDEGTGVLTLAGDERGLATGRELLGAYGRDGVFATFDGTELRKRVPEFPFARIGVSGKSVADFHVTAEGAAPIEGLDEITEGALSGLLDSPTLVVGASSRYAKYDAVVKTMIADASRTVSKQNFLVRGVLEDLLGRYKKVLRSWNGRVMVGIGPTGHVVAALGANDAKQGAAALSSLVGAGLDNLALARTFGVSVPKLRFQRNRVTTAGVAVQALTVVNARTLVPPELGPLLDAKGDLQIAYGGSQNAGAVLVAVGPTAADALSKWIESTKGASPGQATQGDLIAASFAVAADNAAALLQSQPTLATLLGLKPSRVPTVVTATRKDTTFDVHVTGPLPRVVERPARAPRQDPLARQPLPRAR